MFRVPLLVLTLQQRVGRCIACSFSTGRFATWPVASTDLFLDPCTPVLLEGTCCVSYLPSFLFPRSGGEVTACLVAIPARFVGLSVVQKRRAEDNLHLIVGTYLLPPTSAPGSVASRLPACCRRPNHLHLIVGTYLRRKLSPDVQGFGSEKCQQQTVRAGHRG